MRRRERGTESWSGHGGLDACEGTQPRLALILGAVVLLLALTAVRVPAALADTIPVGDGDVDGLIGAIDQANSDPTATTITLSPSATYVLTRAHGSVGDVGLPCITTTITIEGQGAVIKRESEEDFRIFYVWPSGDLTLKNATVMGGGSDIGPLAGGGILNWGGTLTIEGSTISSNTVAVAAIEDVGGGGIANYTGTLTIKNSEILTNRTRSLDRSGGGGIYNTCSGVVSINGTSITNNAADGNPALGGGIANESGSVTIVDSVVADKLATHLLTMAAAGYDRVGDDGSTMAGGGAANAGALTIRYSTVSSDTAPYGGGVYNAAGGTISLSSSTVCGNEAEYRGGGLLNDRYGIGTLVNCTISGNSVDAGGGGLNNGGTLTISHTTICTNTAEMGGGVYEGSPETVTFSHSIVAGNEADTADEIYV